MSTAKSFTITLLLSVFFCISCTDNSYFPRPSGYLRIDLPQAAYQRFDTTFPYSFDYSNFARIEFENDPQSDPFWINISYPRFNGKIHMSYKDLAHHDLYTLHEDARNFVYRHASKAIGIRESIVTLTKSNTFGMVYFIDGKDAASPFQFWVTDSVNHFVRGALYFNLLPNNDSLKPVIDFIVNDVDHMLATFQWK
ncbi:MAG: gliding motility lipoprotein GldD [Bacteroidales bacterium]|nr:gliding motility lipoprotein GldD [Bacteroidales bacterium]